MEETKRAKLQAIEDEMSITWDPAENHHIKELPSPVKKKYFNQYPVRYQDFVEIWALENSQFVVFYSPTGSMFLFDKWQEATRFRQSRVEHLKASYRAFGG